ncbi:MAG: hypothetical protein JNM07_00405 [Phycisphaerae bacterium]|nr:hypothetical protein [Phycisphaerae bacterium]
MSRLAQLEKLLALDPGDAFVLYGLAQEHAKAGRHAEALVFYDRCTRADPGYCYAYFHQARSLQALERIDEARDILRLGLAAARRAGDAKALNELTGFLDSI